MEREQQLDDVTWTMLQEIRNRLRAAAADESWPDVDYATKEAAEAAGRAMLATSTWEEADLMNGRIPEAIYEAVVEHAILAKAAAAAGALSSAVGRIEEWSRSRWAKGRPGIVNQGGEAAKTGKVGAISAAGADATAAGEGAI